MDFASVDTYLNKMRSVEAYTSLESFEQEKAVFEATELLTDHFAVHKLTDRAVALQTVYMLEGEEEEFARLKRQGVKSYAVKGVSVSFEGSGVSPDVINLLTPSRAAVGRLV